ncbi:MAG: hypothetical protein PHY15_07290 [Eubacteriales bacterium]|nr:hypothetical protein [Eubacteriales bacterium]MDD4476357.1 hypothetical protein [Eubacteriales bacterium]
MINKLSINWENCYGIKSLHHEFLFGRGCPIHLIYAPNGSMKTSFAKTMSYLSDQAKDKPCDLLHKENESKCEVLVDNNTIPKEDIFVVNGDDDIDSSKSFINFLASSELKSKYDEIYNKLTTEKEALMSKLKSISSSTDCEKELKEAFLENENDTIFNILERLESKINRDVQHFNFRYNDIFDTKGAVREFLNAHKQELNDYINNYKKLLMESTLFRSIDGHSFGTYQANQLAQNMSDGNFFGVKHKIILQDGTAISTYEQLLELISDEQKRVLNDEKLKKAFEKITKAIDKNSELRGFKSVLELHTEWIIEMLDYESFKKKVWIGFLSENEVKPLFDSYIKVYSANKQELLDILKKAGKEQDKWKNIINLYNNRFHVPFRVSISNQRDIILKLESAKLQFSYVEDGLKPIIKDRKELDKILSRGEKRAFIILQFLFEIESRKTANHDTVLIMDDIADSFDYQNKYAILEYLKDIVEDNSQNFYLLVLTHNYDFYRTVSSRLYLHEDYLWMAERLNDGNVLINKGKYKGNVFINVFVNHDDNDKIFISMIPFVRNIIEYTKGDDSEDYSKLTECLHVKVNTLNLTESDIITIMENYTLGKGMKRVRNGSQIYTLIMSTADLIIHEQTPDPVLIENKIVLSIAIRLLAEKYMYDKLISAGKSESELLVNRNQTGKWTKLFKKTCSDDNVDIIERVNMMTPELIHLNSFMFEPLIDMSIHHLITLYKDCKTKLVS